MPLFNDNIIGVSVTGNNTAGTPALINNGAAYLIGGNNVTLSQQGNSISISAAAGGGGGGIDTVGISNLGNTAGNSGTVNGTAVQLIIAGGNNITVSQSTNGSSATITISSPNMYNEGISNIGNTSGTSGTFSNQIVWAGGNNITLSQSTGVNGATITISAFTQTVQTQGFSNTFGMSNLGNTSGTSGVVSGTGVNLFFAGGNNVTLSQSINGQSATITISSPSNMSAGMTNSGQTSGTTGLASKALYLIGTNGIGLSQSTNAGSNTISMQPSPYISNLFIGSDAFGNAGLGQGGGVNTPQFFPYKMSWPMTATRVDMIVSGSFSSSSNSSYAGSITFNVGVYTRNVSTLSLASSGSTALQFTNTSNNSIASLTGYRAMTAPVNLNMTPGEYWIGWLSNTATANANWYTLSRFVVVALTQTLQGVLGGGTATSVQIIPGFGIYSTTTNAMPGSVPFSAINGQGTNAGIPLMMLQNQTF